MRLKISRATVPNIQIQKYNLWYQKRNKHEWNYKKKLKESPPALVEEHVGGG